MKTTIDLPPELVRELKQRALDEGKKLKDVAAEVIRNGLPRTGSRPVPPAKRRRVKLPIINAHPGAPVFDVSPEEIDRLLGEQELRWLDEAAGR